MLLGQLQAELERLTAIPGGGPVTATALVAAIGNGAGFRRGKDLAAWVGMVPREYSTGGKQRLLGISKRGNSYLRRRCSYRALESCCSIAPNRLPG